MAWQIYIGKFRLGLLDSVKIHRSVDLLADTAEICLPATALNRMLDIESCLQRGDRVSIALGYDDVMTEEFTGFLQEISVNGGNITLNCEDALFLLRKPVGDAELKNIPLKNLLEHVIRETGIRVSVVCSYEFSYEKFVISRATGYDILKKVQEETKANIYMKGSVLHVHPAYEELFGSVRYDFFQNIEKDNLTYKRADERKFEVEVEGMTKDGQSVKVMVGTTGGDRRSVKVYGVTDPALLKKRGAEELKYLVYDGYEGNFTTWLLPYCDAGYSAEVRDREYPHKDGKYYVTAVTTEFSQNGGIRKVQLGRKLK